MVDGARKNQIIRTPPNTNINTNIKTNERREEEELTQLHTKQEMGGAQPKKALLLSPIKSASRSPQTGST